MARMTDSTCGKPVAPTSSDRVLSAISTGPGIIRPGDGKKNNAADKIFVHRVALIRYRDRPTRPIPSASII